MSNILLLSILGSGLAGLVFILKLIAKNKFYGGLQYYIWFIVVLRFLIPIFPEISYTSTKASNVITPIYSQQAVNNNIANNLNAETTNEIPNKIDTKSKIDVIKIITSSIPIIWLAGFVISLMLNILFYTKFKKKVFKYNVDNNYIACILDYYKKQLNIKRKIYVFQNSYISTPMLIGFLKPVILVPLKDFSLEELTYIYRHELMHYKKFDMLIKHIINFTVCVHWFNPIIYMLKNELNKCCELSCDEAVIRGLNKSQCKIYGNMILKIAENNTEKSIPFVSALYEDKKILKERLISIMNFKQITKRASSVSIALVLTVSTVAVFCGTTFAENKAPLTHKISQVVSLPLPNRSNMTAEEIDFFSKITKNTETTKYSRPDLDSEKEKISTLYMKYIDEGLRPEKSLPVDDKTAAVYYDTAQNLIYYPERELTDEEMLQVVDFTMKQSGVASPVVNPSMPNLNTMTKEEIDFFTTVSEDMSGSLKSNRVFSDSERKKKMTTLWKQYSMEGVRPKKTMPVDDKASAVYYDTEKKLLYYSDKELTDEEILQITDFEVKMNVASPPVVEKPVPKLTKEDVTQVALNAVKNLYSIDTSVLYVSANFTISDMQNAVVLSEAEFSWIVNLRSLDFNILPKENEEYLEFSVNINDDTSNVMDISSKGSIFKDAKAVDVADAKKTNWIKDAEKVLKETLGETRKPKDAFSYVRFVLDTESMNKITDYINYVPLYILANYVNVVFEFEDNTSCVISLAYPTGKVVGYNIFSAVEKDNNTYNFIPTRENISEIIDETTFAPSLNTKGYIINEK